MKPASNTNQNDPPPKSSIPSAPANASLPVMPPIPIPIPQIDPKEVARRQAAARAYAMSSHTADAHRGTAYHNIITGGGRASRGGGSSSKLYSAGGRKGKGGARHTAKSNSTTTSTRSTSDSTAGINNYAITKNFTGVSNTTATATSRRTLQPQVAISSSSAATARFHYNKVNHQCQNINVQTQPNKNKAVRSLNSYFQSSPAAARAAAVTPAIVSLAKSNNPTSIPTATGITTASSTSSTTNSNTCSHYRHHNTFDQYQLQQKELQLKYITELSNKIDDEEYIKFVQGLWMDNHNNSNNIIESKSDTYTSSSQKNVVVGTTASNTAGNGTNSGNMKSSGTSISNGNNNDNTHNDDDNHGKGNKEKMMCNKLQQPNNNDNSNGNSNTSINDEDDDDEEYHQGDDEDDDDDDDDEEEEEEEEGDDENESIRTDKSQSNNKVSSTTAINASTTKETTPNSSSSNFMDKNTTTAQEHSITSSTTNNNIHELDDFEIDHETLEQELGSLLEEDMEAAVNSLLYHQDNFIDGAGGLLPLLGPLPVSPLGKQDRIGGGINADFGVSAGGMIGDTTFSRGTLISTPKSKHEKMSTVTSPTNNKKISSVSMNNNHDIKSPPNNVKSNGRSIPHFMPPTLSSPMKQKHTSTTSTMTTAPTSSSSSTHPIPTEEQVLKLYKLMKEHYQILLQQAVLAVRAAHGNKYNKDVDKNTSSSANIDSTIDHSQNYLPFRPNNHINDNNNRNNNNNIVAMTDQTALQNAMYQRPQPHHYNNSLKRKRHHEFFFCGETADDLGMILDGAVTMLQDLDHNRKDAIRYSILMSRNRKRKRKLLDNDVDSDHHGLYSNVVNSTSGNINTHCNDNDDDDSQEVRGRLTRSAFSRTLQENKWGGDGGMLEYEDPSQKSNLSSGGFSNSSTLSFLEANTTFGVMGLARLDQTFAAIDNSLNAAVGGTAFNGIDIFDDPDHGKACELLLMHARADYDKNLIPGYRDLSQLLTFPGEFAGSPAEVVNKIKDKIPLTKEQQTELRKNRGQFTTSEDNLLLRGVNLYGEKEWTLISDRYLPDRSVSSISQRYWRLCLLIYKGQGIAINDKGELEPPPANIKSVDDLDEALIANKLKPVQKPIEFGLYRWSMEEDILLLKAVPLMGRLFAEIGKRFIPYRDRGALRKRFQVLERRVKGALKRDKRSTNDIVRKNVAPLLEAITKKGPLPVPTSSGSSFNSLATQNQSLPQYKNTSKHPGAPPTLPFASQTARQSQPQQQYHTTSKVPQAPINGNQSFPKVQHKVQLPTPTIPESPLNNDNHSQYMFEKGINEFSKMSSFMDEQLKETNNSLTMNQASLPYFSLDNSHSGLSMLSNSDVKPSNVGTCKGDNDRSGSKRLMPSSVFGLPPTAAQSFASPPKPTLMANVKDEEHNQSLDGLNFANLPKLPSLPMTEESQHAFFQKDESVLQTPRTPNSNYYYMPPQHGFSQFPNIQESPFFASNSLMIPDHHEVDAAATLSQMSNSSANFAANFLSPKKENSSPTKSKSSSKPSLFQQVTKNTK